MCTLKMGSSFLNVLSIAIKQKSNKWIYISLRIQVYVQCLLLNIPSLLYDICNYMLDNFEFYIDITLALS